jgi:guanine nucleotide-binding protein G(i) subunit alpha
MHVLLDAMEMMGISLSDPRENQGRANIILSLPHQIEGDAMEPAVADAIHGLWRDEGVRRCFQRSREFQLNDSCVSTC